MTTLSTIIDTLSRRYVEYVDSKLRDYLSRRCDREFLDVVLYQIETGGKRIRPIITLLFTETLGKDFKEALPEACIVELIHEYSLIFDDIIDRSVVRRKRNTAWREFGQNFAILAGLWYREAIEEAILETKNPKIVSKLVSETIREIIEGERLDILLEATGREDPYYMKYRIIDRINIEDIENIYLKMIEKKTVALFKLSSILGTLAVVDNLENEYVYAACRYGENIGKAFQMIDDLLDIYGEFTKFGKEIGKDIKEHKIGNAVVVYTLKNCSKDDRELILNTLKKDNIESEDIKRLIEIFNKYNAKNVVFEKARYYVAKAIEAISKLPENEHRKNLEEIARFIVEREF